VRQELRLALFLNLRVYHDGVNYTADERYYEFWTSLAGYFDEVILCVPVLRDALKKGSFCLDLIGESVKICSLPFYRNSRELYAKSHLIIPKIRKVISREIGNWDIIGAVVPNILGLCFLREADRNRKMSFAYVRGNHLNTVKNELNGLEKIFGLCAALVLELMTRRIVRRRLTFVVGMELYKKFMRFGGPARRIVVSLVSDRDIRHDKKLVEREGKRIEVIHIGRLSRERGVGFLIQAVEKLIKRHGRKVILTVIGSGPDEEKLKLLARSLDIEEEVKFTGHIPYGRRLTSFLDRSDVFVLPSLTEGVPKTLIEAMANGVPVVATAVGGIPEIMRHGVEGLLVPPKDPEAIAGSIVQVMSDRALREKLISNALERVREFTIERQRENVLKSLEEHYYSRVAG